MLLFVERWAYFLPCVYLMASIPIFEQIFKLAPVVVDEEFHLPQGKHYCGGSFDIWNNKITTFPGLYILTSILLPFKLCTTFALRFMNLMASCFNLFLIIKLESFYHGNKLNVLMDALIIILLPPMYFFSHVYYTDVISITTILGMFNCWVRGYHKSVALVGIGSVLMRQTNVIWVLYFFAISAANEVIIKTKPMFPDYQTTKGDSKMKVNADADITTLLHVIGYNLTNKSFLMQNISHILCKFWGYMLVFLGFGAFVLYNGSIVVGDKSAHQATLHIPQIFYFTLFLLIFGPSILIQNGLNAAKNCIRHWKLTLFMAVLVALIVNYNTIVHPYLLADNRHYTFYIWNRFYGKSYYAKFIPIPFYIYGLYLIFECLQAKQATTQVIFIICLFLVLGFQSLIEVRYFLIPFLILRLNLSKLSWKYYLLDLILYVTINLITLKIFFTKTIYWKDYPYPQRIMW